MKAFRRTNDGEAILRDGFSDREGRYMTGRWWRGMWVSDYPLGANEGAEGDDLLVVEIPEKVFTKYEWVQPGFQYREALIPASILNSCSVHRAEPEEEELSWFDPDASEAQSERDPTADHHD